MPPSDEVHARRSRLARQLLIFNLVGATVTPAALVAEWLDVVHFHNSEVLFLPVLLAHGTAAAVCLAWMELWYFPWLGSWSIAFVSPAAVTLLFESHEAALRLSILLLAVAYIALLLIPLWALEYGRGVKLRRDDGRRPPLNLQFGLRAMLSVVAVTGVALGIWRWFLGQVLWENPPALQLSITAAISLLTILAALRRSYAVAATLAVVVLAAATTPVVWWAPFYLAKDFPASFALQNGVVIGWSLVFALILRRGGYRVFAPG